MEMIYIVYSVILYVVFGCLTTLSLLLFNSYDKYEKKFSKVRNDLADVVFFTLCGTLFPITIVSLTIFGIGYIMFGLSNKLIDNLNKSKGIIE